MADSERGYVDYFAVLGVGADAKPGEIRNNYKKRMKDLLMDISQANVTEERRDKFLLQIAQLNAAFFILRDSEIRQHYADDRARVMALEEEWTAAAAGGAADSDRLRRSFDAALRHYLSTYMEDRVLEAGRDAECVEASHWDMAHERHATRILRHYRQRLYHEIQERLPFYEVTTPVVDWEERARAVGRLIAAEG